MSVAIIPQAAYSISYHLTSSKITYTDIQFFIIILYKYGTNVPLFAYIEAVLMPLNSTKKTWN